MNIHHAMIIHTLPDKVYEALIQPGELEAWMGAPTTARPEVGSVVEFRYDQGRRALKMEITRLETGKLVQWRVVQPAWPAQAATQLVTWTLAPYESSTLVDFCMEGWPQDDDVYASVSYKWASFMLRLKVYLGDTRDISSFLPANRGQNQGNSV